MPPTPGDVFCVYNRAMKQYAAYQITKVKEKGFVTLALDWTGEEPLTPEELPALRPLAVDFLFWPEAYRLTNVPPPVPADYLYVGNVPPLTEEDSRSYGSWSGGYEVWRQRWWETIPEEDRKAFKAAVASREEMEVAGTRVRKNLSHVCDDSIPFEDVRELRTLRCLTTLECTRWRPGLLEFARENPFLIDLRLENHGQKKLDLRGTHIQRLRIDLAGVEELWLSEEAGSLLLLSQEGESCIIHAPGGGDGLGVEFTGRVQHHPELPRLSSVHCQKVDELDVEALADWYPDLRQLRLWGRPGYLRNFSALKRFGQLEGFTTVDLFGFAAADIPLPEELPNLTWFWMFSLPEDAARAARKLYKKREGLNLRITKARKPDWVKENMGNPFRRWDGMDGVPASSAKRAKTLYNTLRAALLRLAEERPADAMDQAAAAVAAYVKPFNRMRFIETEEREDIYTALCGVLDELPEGALDRERLIGVFEDHRDF